MIIGTESCIYIYMQASTGRCFFSFRIFKKHLYVYVFPAYIDTNICLINGDVKDSDGVSKGDKNTVRNYMYCEGWKRQGVQEEANASNYYSTVAENL